MARQVVRALAAFAAGAVLALGFAPGALAAAGSAPQVGLPAVLAAAQARDYCDPGDGNSVTVVVDFSGVGGGIDIRCSSGSTGQQALGNAFGYLEIASQPGFVCQISGTPASDCQNTPPGAVYWSYWQAAPGGGWAYSSRGFSSSRVKPGGFEGWAYGSGGPPGIDPVLPAAPEPEPPAPEPVQPAPQPEAPAAPEPEQPAAEQPAAEPAPDNGAADNPAATDSATDSPAESAPGSDPDAEAAAAAAAAQAQAEAEAAAQASAAQAAAVAAAAQAAEASASAAAASASSASAGSAAESNAVTTSSGDSAALSSNEPTSGSTIWFSVVALFAVASLGTAAVVMARRRRAGAGDDQAG
jgi:hypothetical protein